MAMSVEDILARRTRLLFLDAKLLYKLHQMLPKQWLLFYIKMMIGYKAKLITLRRLQKIIYHSDVSKVLEFQSFIVIKIDI